MQTRIRCEILDQPKTMIFAIDFNGARVSPTVYRSYTEYGIVVLAWARCKI